MLTIYDWFGYEIPLKERYRLIRQAGFDGVLMWWSDGFGRDIHGLGDYRNSPKAARDASLFIENIHAPVHMEHDLWQNDLAGEDSFACYLQCLTDCATFEIPAMVVHLPKEKALPTPIGLYRIKHIAEKAEQLGINVAMENITNLPSLSFVLDQVDSQRIGFCYDVAHHHRNYPGTDLLGMYGHRLMALHLHDNDGTAMHKLPLDGTIDWPAAMRAVANTGYTGPTAIEAMNWEYTDISPQEFLAKAYQSAQTLERLRHP